jgi:hypothetical protein
MNNRIKWKLTYVTLGMLAGLTIGMFINALPFLAEVSHFEKVSWGVVAINGKPQAVAEVSFQPFRIP